LREAERRNPLLYLDSRLAITAVAFALAFAFVLAFLVVIPEGDLLLPSAFAFIFALSF
jgi:hypothetical protein